jgi:Domain of unknown function (DUF5615)
VTRRRRVALVLDEMFSPAIAAELRSRGFDVLSVAADSQLRSMSDLELYKWATERGRRIVTENVKDFRPLSRQETAGPGLLFTSTRTFPRSRRAVGLLIGALDSWLRRSDAHLRGSEDWLQRPSTRPRRH